MDLDDDEDIDEESKEKKAAIASAELSRILANSDRNDKSLSKYEWTRKKWINLGIHSGYECFAGSIKTETGYKKPKTFREKVVFFDEYIRFFLNGVLVLLHKIEYVGGFRASYHDEVNKAIADIKMREAK